MRRLSHLVQLCLVLLLLLQGHLSWAKRGGGFKSSVGWGKKPSTSKTGGSSRRPGQGTQSQPGNYPRQPQSPNQNPARGYPAAGGYPNQNPGRGGVNPGGYPNQYPPAGGYPAGGSYPAGGGYPARGGGYPNQYGGGAYPGGAAYPGGYPNRGGAGWGQQGGYPGSYPGGGYQGGVGGYPNWNPNNRILSPRYGGGYGYGGGGYGRGGSPFSHSVQGMGMGPSLQSRGFGKQAAMAAGVGVVAGMAMGYGLGRFPRPHFQFHNPQEEYYYNRYMYRRYGSRSTDDNDYGRDYRFKQPSLSYDSYMDDCMKRPDLLQGQNGSSPGGPAVPNTQRDGGDAPEAKSVQSDDPNAGESAANLTTPEPATANDTVTESSPNSNDTEAEQGKASPATAAPVPTAGGEKKDGDGGDDNDDDTVTILEIGYPELIEQLKARRCVVLYMVYSERYLEKQTAERSGGIPKGSGECQRPLCQGLVLLLTTLLMLFSSTLLLQ